MNCGLKQPIAGGAYFRTMVDEQGVFSFELVDHPITHIVIETGKKMRQTGAPEQRVVSVDGLAGTRTVWFQAGDDSL